MADVDWFERLTGFAEDGYARTQGWLEASGDELRSKVNDRRFGIGELEIPSLGELRRRTAEPEDAGRGLSLRNVIGDVRAMHLAPDCAGALFQVASQFNLLEMSGPDVTPEQGVTRYALDRTQGPACALAAAAATIWRNYFMPVGGGVGQTAERQMDALDDLGRALEAALGRPREALWVMRNGYALCEAAGLTAIAAHLEALDEAERDRLRALLRIGVHRDVEVTDGARPGPRVSQAFCSALPVAYGRPPAEAWRPFATLVLEAAYEATLRAAVLNAQGGRSTVVLLTRLGGGAFGNDDRWIDAALVRALRVMARFDLEVRLVSHQTTPASMRALERAFAR